MNAIRTGLRQNLFGMRADDVFVLFLLVFKFFALAFFFPEFEMPDEHAHFTRIVDNSRTSVYYIVMHKVFIFFRKMLPGLNVPGDLTWNTDFSYASNLPAWIHADFNSACVIIFKHVHLAAVLFFIFAVFFILKKSKRLEEDEKGFIFRIHLLYFSWPAVSFSIMGLSSDFMSYLFMPIFFLSLVYYNRIFPMMILSAILWKFVDNNAFFMLVTAFFYMIFWYSSRPGKRVFSVNKRMGLAFLSFILLFSYAFLIKMNFIGRFFPAIAPHVTYNYQFGYEPLKSMGTCFLGLYYLGGTASFRAFWLEYILFFLLLTFFLFRIFEGKTILENKFFIFLLSSFLTFHVVLLTFPTIDQGRYYYFLIPAVFAFFSHYVSKDKFSGYKYYVMISLLLFLSTAVKIFSAYIRSFVL